MTPAAASPAAPHAAAHAPADPASPPGPEEERSARLPAFLAAEPVSRHTRNVLYATALLLLVLELAGPLIGPALDAWLLNDPELRASAEAAPEIDPTINRIMAGVGIGTTLLFAWQPSAAAVLVLAGTAAGLGGVLGADDASWNPTAFAGGVVLGSVMVARYSRRGFAWAALAAVIGLTVATELLADGAFPDETSLSGVMTMMTLTGLAAAVPAVVIRRARHRVRDREEAVRVAQEQAECAAAAERQRIATELHDVVAHGLTVISMQAAMLPTLQDPQRRAAAETAIEDAARQSLVDLRRMLTALRGSARNEQTGEADGVVDLRGRLDELETRLHAAGFAVERTMRDLDALPRSMELTVLRVVQECVTNVLKHAPVRGTVRMCSAVDEAGRLVLDVTSPLTEGEPRTDRTVEALSSGFGLAGMRERVEVFGGTLVAGPEGACWTVRAVLPTR